MEKLLSLNIQNDVNGYLIYTYPYTILNDLPEYKDYIMENYVQCFGFVNDNNDITFEYEDGIGYNNMFYNAGPLDIMWYPYETGIQLKIKDLIISSIDSNSYVVIFVDEYYVENRPSYKVRHNIHEIMIYGYDDERFYYFAFDNNSKLTTSSFPQIKIGIAYKRGYKITVSDATTWINEKSIILLKPKNIQNKYIYSSERFINKLKLYLNGEFTPEYDSFIISKEKCYIGINNTNLILYSLTNLDANIGMLYSAIHAWCESKYNLYNKILYFTDNANLNIENLSSDYKNNVVKKANMVRLSFLKLIRYDRFDAEQEIATLKKIYNSEYNILKNIIEKRK